MFLQADSICKTVSSSILLGALANGDSLSFRPYIISELVNYFLGYEPATSLRETLGPLLAGSNYPNPFSKATRIDYILKEPGQVDIQICDLSGKIVKKLLSQVQTPGKYSVDWDGTDESGKEAESGFYFCRIISGNASSSLKMILIH